VTCVSPDSGRIFAQKVPIDADLPAASPRSSSEADVFEDDTTATRKMYDMEYDAPFPPSSDSDRNIAVPDPPVERKGKKQRKKPKK
jgi:hypothetical protein